MNLDICTNLYATPDAVAAPLFTYSHNDPVADGDGCAIGSSVAATPTDGALPLHVEFDGTASSDPDGDAIVGYEWDLDGTCAYHSSCADPQSEPTTRCELVCAQSGGWTGATRPDLKTQERET